MTWSGSWSRCVREFVCERERANGEKGARKDIRWREELGCRLLFSGVGVVKSEAIILSSSRASKVSAPTHYCTMKPACVTQLCTYVQHGAVLSTRACSGPPCWA